MLVLIIVHTYILVHVILGLGGSPQFTLYTSVHSTALHQCRKYQSMNLSLGATNVLVVIIGMSCGSIERVCMYVVCKCTCVCAVMYMHKHVYMCICACMLCVYVCVQPSPPLSLSLSLWILTVTFVFLSFR